MPRGPSLDVTQSQFVGEFQDLGRAMVSKLTIGFPRAVRYPQGAERMKLQDVDLHLEGRRSNRCHQGHCPGDDLFGLDKTDLTSGAAELTTLAGTLDNFARAADVVLPKMSGLSIAESTVCLHACC